jgi:trehalose/maltose hydrolase-like predicted phosphorylase
VLSFGCSAPPSKPPASIKGKTVPSSWKIADVRYQPERTIAEPTPDSKDSYWVPTAYEKSGEEKLQFELKSGQPRLEINNDSPVIQLIGSTGDMAAVREMSRHLVSAARRKTLPVAQYGFGPFGVSNDLYFGHTFWDADVWILPALLFLEPQGAKDIAKYRLERLRQASLNYRDSRTKGSKQVFAEGVKFPWESSVTGREVCVEKTMLQEHISGDVVWGLDQAAAFGLIDSGDVERVARGVKKYYDIRSIKTSRGREIKDVVSPNEKFTGDNDLYTNLLAEWISNDRHWKVKPNYYLPKDNQSFLNYDNDPMRDYQQVAGLLSIYPLQYPPAEKQAEVMINRFESGLSSNGVAMSHSVIATIYARLGQKRKAYEAWKQSWVPYLVGNNKLFSERKNVERTYFYTGAAGALNTVIYGFAGFRIDTVPLPGAKWTKRLKSGYWLSCNPHVPEEIGKILFTGLVLEGKKYDFEMSSTGQFSAQLSASKG